MKACVLIPIYNHPARVATTVAAIAETGLDCIIVDDGSTDTTPCILAELAGQFLNVRLLSHPKNRGKGAAVATGAIWAYRNGYTHAVQIDADGQHCVDDISRFVQAAEASPTALILGAPEFDETAPRLRRLARKLTTRLIVIEVGSNVIADGMCGFRVYPLERVSALIEHGRPTMHMDFDVEIVVRLACAGVPVVSIPTKVRYYPNNPSHFRCVIDNLRMVALHARLVPRMFLVRCGFSERWTRERPSSSPAGLAKPVRGGLESVPARTQEQAHGLGDALPYAVENTDAATQQPSVVWASAKERGSEMLLRFMFWLYRVLGRRVCLLCLYPTVAYFVLTARQARRASLQYLNHVASCPRGLQALGSHPSWALVYRHMLEFGRSLVDKVSAWTGDIMLHETEWDGRTELRNALTPTRGAVLFGSHLGYTEVLRSLADGLPDLRLNALMYVKHTAQFNRVLEAANRASFVRIVPVDRISPEVVLDLKERIQRGEIVAILADRITAGSPERKVRVPFMGASAPFPEGPFILASLLECPVFLLFCLREHNRYHVFFEHFADRLEFARKTRASSIAATVAKFAARLESYCLKAPLQWFNFYDYWDEDDAPSLPEAPAHAKFTE